MERPQRQHLRWALEEGALWPPALDAVRTLAPENVPGLGKDLGLAKMGWELGAAREEGVVGGEAGRSPAPACPLSRPRTLPGSPRPQLLAPALPGIASLPGRAAPARSARARNRARPRGRRAAGARGRPSSETDGGAGTRARLRDRVARAGIGDPGRGGAQAEILERGREGAGAGGRGRVPGVGGSGLWDPAQEDSGAGDRDPGRQASPRRRAGR